MSTDQGVPIECAAYMASVHVWEQPSNQPGWLEQVYFTFNLIYLDLICSHPSPDNTMTTKGPEVRPRKGFLLTTLTVD